MSLVYPIVPPHVALRACSGHFFGLNQLHVAVLYSDRVVFREAAGGSLLDDEVVIYIPRPEISAGDPDNFIAPNLGGAFFAIGRTKDVIGIQIASSLLFLSINPVSNTFELQGSWGVPRIKDASLYKASSAISLASLSLSEPSASSRDSVKSKNSIKPGMPLPAPSPDGTHVFLATRSKGGHAVLVILSAYGDELIRVETDYTEVMTLGWLTDDSIYFVYTNGKFHKKFQVCRLKNKMRQTGFLGMGRKAAIKPSLSYEITVILAPDFQSSVLDMCGGSDLIFADHVLLATRNGGYIRVNHRNGAWENVLNIKNVIGAICMGAYGVVIQNANGNSVPAHATQLSYSIASSGGSFKAVKCDLAVSACLASTNDIDGMNRYVLKLLRLSDTEILDFKREPMRVYEVKQNNLCYINIADDLPTPPVTTKSSLDFMVKTDQALYTRDPNGDDDTVRKIASRNEIVDIVFDRPGLVTLAKRGPRSMYAAFNGVDFEGQLYPPEVKVVEESHRTCNLKTKAVYRFEMLPSWHISVLSPVHDGAVLVGLSSERLRVGLNDLDEFKECERNVKWAVYILNFVGSIGKQGKPVRAHLLIKSQVPDVHPVPLKLPGVPVDEPSTSRCYSLQVYNMMSHTFVTSKVLTVRLSGEHTMREARLDNPFPYVLQSDSQTTFFTDYRDPINSVFLAGRWHPTDNFISDVMLVESPEASDGSSVVISNPDPMKSAIWLFDSNGTEFRELTICEKTNELGVNLAHHQQQLRATQAPSTLFAQYKISPQFNFRYFKETCANNWFRPLPEIPAIVCQGAGYGTDAEAYIKTPDLGIYAIFRIQNKKLLDMLRRLMVVMLQQRIGAWLPEPMKQVWLADLEASANMISGNTFAAFYALSPEEQRDICHDANVDIDVMRKVRPP